MVILLSLYPYRLGVGVREEETAERIETRGEEKTSGKRGERNRKRGRDFERKKRRRSGERTGV